MTRNLRRPKIKQRALKYIAQRFAHCSSERMYLIEFNHGRHAIYIPSDKCLRAPGLLLLRAVWQMSNTLGAIVLHAEGLV